MDEFEESSAPEEIQKEARTMGWVPKEKFKGNPDHWIDAEEFVERGHQVMPILLQNNKRLQGELSTRDRDIDTLKQSLQSANVAIEKLEKHYTAANKRAVETAKLELKAQLKQAREDGNLDDELDIQEKLGELNKSTEDSPTVKPAEKKEPEGETYSKEFTSWQKDNSWFGGTSKEDKQKTKAVTRIAEDLRDEGTELSGIEFMDECVRLYEETQEEKPEPRRPSSKVEGTPPRSNGKTGSKSFNDLPADARKACLDDADELVGENKRYKTLDAWKKRYTEIYYSTEE